MSEPLILLRPRVSWPRHLEMGERYLVTVNLEHSSIDDWPYGAEEYPITCMLTGDIGIDIRVVDSPTAVLHRFGGTYGPVQFVVCATEEYQPRNDAELVLTLVTAGGQSIRTEPLAIGDDRSTTIGESELIQAQQNRPLEVEDPDSLPPTPALEPSAPDGGERPASAYESVDEPPRPARARPQGPVMPAPRFRPSNSRHEHESMPNDTFVGRRAELSELLRLLETAGSGQPALTLLSGEAGVGKSRLLERFAEEAADRGALVLRGGCIELGEGAIPYAPLVDALRQTVRTHGRDQARALIGPAWEQLGELVSYFDERRSSPDTAPGEASQMLIYSALLQILDHAGAEKPVALIFEDLHWADRSTLDLVAYLARARTTGRAMITCSHRTDLSPGHPLRRLLAEPDFERRTNQVRLDCFDEKEMGVFLRLRMAAVNGDVVRRAFQLSEGNPFYAEQLMLSGWLTGAKSGLPPSLNELMLSRLDGLSRNAIAVLQVVATAARKVDDELLAAVSQLDDDALDEGLTDCVGLGMLQVNREDDSYSVKHALLREAVYDAMTPRRRRVLHNAMAEAILRDAGRQPADPGLAVELAHHWDRAGRDTEALGAWIRAGAMSAARRAFHEADNHYAKALRLWARVPDPVAATALAYDHLLAAAADARRWTGHVTQAVEMIEQAIGMVDASAEPRRAGELFERLGSYRWEAGAQDESVEAYESARRLLMLAGGRTAEDARVSAGLATALLRRGRYAEGLQEAELAAELAEEVYAEAERGRALNAAGVALAFLDRHEEAESRLQEAKAIAERSGRFDDLLRVYANLGVAREHAGDLSAAIEASLAGLQEARRFHVSGAKQVLILANNAAATMSLLGRWDQAVELLEDVLVEQPPVRETLYLRLTLAEIYARRGQFDEGGRLLDDVQDYLTADPRFLSAFYSCAAERHAWNGDAARAEITVRRGFEAISGTENDLERLRLCAVGLRAAADRCLEGADHQPFDLAAVWGGEARKTLAKGSPLPELRILGAQCAAELNRSRSKDTPRLWASVAMAWLELDRPYPMAYARWREAGAALAVGDREGARRALIEATDVAERLGAAPLLAGLSVLSSSAGVAGTGLPVEPLATDGPAGLHALTPREREVLREVVRGLGNREIARELSIAERTVSVHVSHILSKLGVSSRAQLVARVLDTQPAGDVPNSPRGQELGGGEP